MSSKYFIRAVIGFLSIVGLIALALVIALIMQIASNRQANTSNAPELMAPKSMLEMGDYPSTPEAVLAEYLRLDAEGANLSKRGTEHLKQLNPERNRYGLQRLDFVGVISGYRVLRIQSGINEVAGIIEYDVVGTLVGFASFQQRRGREQHTINLRKHEGKWRLDSELWPKISVVSAISYLQQKNGLDNKNSKKLIHEIVKTSKAEAIGGESPEGIDKIAALMRRYCELEAKGLVGSSAFEKDKREYVTERFHKGRPTERAFIMSRYWIDQINVYRDAASVTVLYEISKNYNGSELKPAAFKMSGQILGLVKTPGGWRINSSNKENPFVYEYVVRH